VESGITSEVVARPAHPYTRALLRSVPSLSTPLEGELAVIPGSPPDPSRPTPGCAFAPRCEFAIATCRERRPALVPLTAGIPGAAGVRVQSRRVACTESERVLTAEAKS
jgi:oligopeptide/dipeptide ABC transporter ATP-binding protein